MWDELGDVGEILKELKVEKVNIVGYCMGGGIGL
ncbi:hypothetical protein [Bacillus pumilus]